MITGFTRLPGRWLRWKMFCQATFTIVTLTGTKDSRTEPVNVYRHLSPGSFLLGPPQLQAVITYLTSSGHYNRIDGTGRVLSAAGKRLTRRLGRLIPGSLSLHLAEQRFGPGRARLLAASYRPALIIRTAAAIALTAGLLPLLSLAAVLARAAMELLYLRSPNAVRYTLLIGSCLLVAGDLGRGLAIEHTLSTANTWAQCLLVLITTDIYWNSAWQKLRSPQFRTGLYLAQWVHVLTQVSEQLPHRRQFAVPGPIRRHLGNLSKRDVRLWQMISTAVIAAEMALPPALLVPATTPWAIALGIGIHSIHLPQAPPTHHLLRPHSRHLHRLRSPRSCPR
ncbi:hypothetical protein [Streptomyces sp. NPDC057253]|uniref:hypothetical protein n=1 Tax=Streptomyces sp. NPDC057253 TaxID=3346069 RepID=UPI00363AFCE4